MLGRLRLLWHTSLRHWARLGLTLALALLCALSAALLWQRRRSAAAQDTLPLADPLANLDQIGVNVDLAAYTPAARERALDQVEQAGFSWVRQRFAWPEIEPARGALDWAAWDAIVAGCQARGLRLIAVLDGTPPWARPDGAGTPLTPPAQVSDWGDFAARVAARYRGQIAAYQLWDEPNLTAHWGGRYVDPQEYGRLLREGAIRIRQADPDAAILLAALAPTVETGPLNLNEIAFLQRLGSALALVDAIALQPYGFGDPPDAAPGPQRLNYRRVALVRRALVRLGRPDCPVWATAGGWSHLAPGWEGDPSPWPSVDAAQQQAYTIQALQHARRDWPWMGPMILYTLRPDAPPGDPRWGFALTSAQGTPRPLYDRLAAYATARRPLYAGTYAPPDAAAGWSAGWRLAPDGADPPRGADVARRNAVLSFDVQSAAFDLVVRRGDYWGVLYLSIDGAPASELPRDEQGRSYLVLYAPAGATARVPVARGLSPHVAHRVEIVAHGGWGQWPIVGWTLYDGPPAVPGAASIAALGLIAAGTLVAAFAQVVLVPQLRTPVYGAIGAAFRRYRALPEWMPVAATLGTALAFYLAPWTALALPLLALWGILAFLRIDLGLATVAFALPFYLRPKVLAGRPLSVVELGLALCFAAWLLARFLDAGRSIGRSAQPLLWRLRQFDAWLRTLPDRLWRAWSALDKGMLALLVVAALSLRWTAHAAVTRRELRVVFGESVLFYALIRLAVRSPRAHQRLIQGWLLGAVAISCLGIVQLFSGQNLITAEGVWRVRGLYGSPNNLALYLERALPVLLALAWRGQHRTARRVYAVAAIPVLAALLMTLSKGALLIGLPAALLALGLAQRRRRATWLALAGVGAVLLLVLPFAFTERFRSILNLRAGTAFFRLKLWRSTLNMIADHPLTGVGMDNFLYHYRSGYVLPSAWGELDLSHPHNLILDAWTRLGLGGVAIVAWLIVSFFRTAWQQLRTATGDRRALLLGLLAAMVGALAHGMVDHALFLIDLAFVFALLLALVQPRGR